MDRKKILYLQEQLDLTLNECKNTWGQAFEIFTSLLVILMAAIFVVETYPISPELYATLTSIEIGITFFFLIEYLVRWWAKKLSPYYPLTPMAIIDLLAILPLFLYETHWQFVRILRLFRILRLLRLFQREDFLYFRISDMHLRLLRILFTLFCIVFISAGLIYDLEHRTNPLFSTFFDALYFAIVGLSTVGFGDITPITFEGRAAALLMIISGITLIPWQVSDLIKSLIAASSKKNVVCKKCGLQYHDVDAVHCKACGDIIYQKYSGDLS